MAVLKNLLVLGPSRLIQDAFAANITATKFITSGGTSSQFVKGDGTLDNSAYLTSHAYNYGQIAPGAASSAVTAPHQIQLN